MGATGETFDNFDAAALASRDYLVIAPNVRGSTGHGRAFEEANRWDLGGRDLECCPTRTGYKARLPAMRTHDFLRDMEAQATSLHVRIAAAHRLKQRIRLNKDWHALGEIVGSALSRSVPILAPRLVRVDLPATLPLIEVDATLIERVLINLLDNAAKYTPPESTILVRAGTSGETMYLVVEDNGPGLPGGDPQKLFEPFSRGQKESSIAGVGLGLALCRSIIVAHGGTIHAESRVPHGSVFEIRLPLGIPPEIESEIGND